MCDIIQGNVLLHDLMYMVVQLYYFDSVRLFHHLYVQRRKDKRKTLTFLAKCFEQSKYLDIKKDSIY